MTTIEQSLAALYAPILEDLIEVERIFDLELDGDLPFVAELCDAIRSYRGKMLRPALLLLSARAAGSLNSSHHVLAAVVEMVHMATLVHDDVLDEAQVRRRQPTIREIRGNVAAVLLGDYLISHAFHLCSAVPSRHASRRIGAVTNTVCEGELLQNSFRRNANLSEGQYLELIRRKTASLTGVCCELGGHFAGAEPVIVDALRVFGESVGVAFQIVDDVLDIVGSSSDMGKTLGLDLAMGKLTLPIIHALRESHGETKEFLRHVVAGDRPPDSQAVCQVLQQAGSLEYAMSVASDCVADAKRRIELLPPSEARQSLSEMAEMILARRH